MGIPSLLKGTFKQNPPKSAKPTVDASTPERVEKGVYPKELIRSLPVADTARQALSHSGNTKVEETFVVNSQTSESRPLSENRARHFELVDTRTLSRIAFQRLILNPEITSNLIATSFDGASYSALPNLESFEIASADGVGSGHGTKELRPKSRHLVLDAHSTTGSLVHGDEGKTTEVDGEEKADRGGFDDHPCFDQTRRVRRRNSKHKGRKTAKELLLDTMNKLGLDSSDRRNKGAEADAIDMAVDWFLELVEVLGGTRGESNGANGTRTDRPSTGPQHKPKKDQQHWLQDVYCKLTTMKKQMGDCMRVVTGLAKVLNVVI